MKTLLDIAKYCMENKKSDNTFVMIGDSYKYQNLFLELVDKQLLIQKGKNYFLVTSQLQEFINNNGKTSSEIIEEERIEREKKSLKIADEANKIAKKANKKSDTSNIIAFLALIIAILALINDFYN